MTLRNFLVMAALAVTACASNGPIGGPGLTTTTMSELPVPDGVDPGSDERAYLVGPFDRLHVKVLGVDELSGEMRVDGSGSISVPLAGTIDASGLTLAKLADEIARRLSDGYVRDPQVVVNLLEPVSQVVTVEGEVENPGIYPVLGKMTLLRAIARAQGTTDYAELDNVIVFRTVDGQRMAGVYNLGAIRRGNYADPEVYANDVVVVGESGTRRLFKDVLQAAPAIVTPLIYIITR